MKYIRPKRAIIILHIFLFIYAKLLQKEERTKDLNIFCIAKEEGEVKSEESNGGSEERRVKNLMVKSEERRVKNLMVEVKNEESNI